MIRRLLTSPEGVAVVIGEAGTGKTFAIVAAAEGWAQAGIELRAAAPTWRAANVMRAEGLPASSIASLLLRARPGRARRRGGLAARIGPLDRRGRDGGLGHPGAARSPTPRRRRAKLVLVGDPEQLGEIEAGGLFRAIAERSDPIHLDEVIRHRHELDRDAAKRITRGRGPRGACPLPVAGAGHGRPERRGAPRGDGRATGTRPSSAARTRVMVAKQNAEVEEAERDCARGPPSGRAARSGRRSKSARRRFAAGDQVITRVNDRAAEIYNRERWRIAEVDAAERRVVLEGIDQAKAGRGRSRLPGPDQPALRSPGARTRLRRRRPTRRRARPLTAPSSLADPSMDKQELYVAASRSREETFIYATPEIQTHREEIAPSLAPPARGHPAHRRSGRARPRAARRPR